MKDYLTDIHEIMLDGSKSDSEVIAIAVSYIAEMQDTMKKVAEKVAETKESLEKYLSKIHTCCICGQEYIGFGNNPAPIKDSGMCCDACNLTVVLNARLFGLKNLESKKE